MPTRQLTLEPADPQRLASLCGPLDHHIRQVEQHFGVSIRNRGHVFEIRGSEEAAQAAASALANLYEETAQLPALTSDILHRHLQASGQPTEAAHANVAIRTRKTLIRPNGRNQQHYVHAIQTHDINFGIGPAGTGKTFLAVACAVQALEEEKVERLLLVRPAVEAGEKLGFLPGDLTQKIDPYLRPLYDALYELMGFDRVMRLIEKQVIEIAPLAYMRGRTLNHSFIILDESQNTTREQMKMFLTRIGFGSTAVITGDITQVDLPKHIPSGLSHAAHVLRHVPGISFTHFTAGDVLRHPLVQRIVEAYEHHDRKPS
ncbi:MAG: PhoH family protein [Gammaproteobacteria bacterium]|nr:MAG: PhoH family protein [Gammaproteobacteria bacterium]